MNPLVNRPILFSVFALLLSTLMTSVGCSYDAGEPISNGKIVESEATVVTVRLIDDTSRVYVDGESRTSEELSEVFQSLSQKGPLYVSLVVDENASMGAYRDLMNLVRDGGVAGIHFGELGEHDEEINVVDRFVEPVVER